MAEPTKMPEPNLKYVAESWARWVAEDIMSELDDRDLLLSDDRDAVHEVLVEHLTDVAMCNAIRAGGTDSKSGGEK